MSLEKYLFLLFLSNIFTSQFAVAQKRDLNYYLAAAYSNNPTLKENLNQQKYTLLQNELNTIIYRKPQVFLTSDYLFAPFFFNKGHFISVTSNPENKAFGYDVALSNGGVYAAQLNFATLLFTSRIIKPYNEQAATQKNILQNNSRQLIHDLDKTVSDQYISTYQLQQQVFYLQKIILLVNDRKKIVEALVQKALMQQNDYLLLEIEIRQRQFEIQQQKISLINAFNLLNNACGISDTAIIELVEPQLIQSLPLNQFNYQQKYKLDSAYIVSQQQVFNIRYRPILTAYGNTGLNSSEAANIPHNFGVSAGLHLSIPIYDGGQQQTMEKQSRLLQENLKQFQNQSEIQIQNNLSSLQRQIKLTQEMIILLNAQLATQETLLSLIKDKVIIGQVSVTDYKNSLQDYALSNQNKLQAQTNLWLLINQYNYINW